MILEFVLFDAPEGVTDRKTALEDARPTLARWRANPDLIRKHYVRRDDGKLGGVYVWKNRAAAEKGHDAAWRAGVKARTGAEPVITYHDMFMLLDNEAGTVTEWPE